MKGTLFPEQGAVVVEALFTGTFALIFELVSLVTKSLCNSTCVFGGDLILNFGSGHQCNVVTGVVLSTVTLLRGSLVTQG